MSQWMNLRALQWAYDQEGLGVTTKAVLTTFAITSATPTLLVGSSDYGVLQNNSV